MRKIQFLSFLLLGSCLMGLISCEPPSEIGTEYFNDESFDLFPLDTFTVDLATVRSDSFETGAVSRLLVGYQEDVAFGTIGANPYFQVGLDQTTSLDEESTRFDSLTISLAYDGYSYFDTSRIMTVALHQITEEFEAEDGFFNTTTLAYDPIPLGSYSFRPRPNRGEPLEFRLSDELGEELYQLIVDGDEIATSQERFLDFIPGFVLLTDTLSSSCFLGFQPFNVQLKLHYTDNAELPPQQLVRSFSSTEENLSLAYFNQIYTHYDNSLLEGFTNGKLEELASAETNNQAFLQGGAALSIQAKFPYLKRLIETGDDFIISKAVLRFGVVDDPFTTDDALLSSLYTIITDDNDEAFAENPDDAALSFDDEFRRDTYYETDVTDFVKSIVYNDFNEDYSLLFRAPTLISSVDRLMIDQLGEAQPELTIFLLKIK
ncbi:MAG: DUF4270 family protein [Bacteroidota bacterium]